MQQEKIANYKLGLAAIRGQKINDNRFLDNDKIESAVFSAAFIAVFERFNLTICNRIGGNLQKTYDTKEPVDVYAAIMKASLKKMFNDKKTLKKADIIDIMVLFDFMNLEDKKEYFKLKKIRDEIGHNLLEMLYGDAERFNKIYLIDLLILFKKTLINIYNNFLILTDKNDNKGSNSFELILFEFALVDGLLSNIIDREEHPDIFRVLEDEGL
ncbi:MAG: hypothetical protein LBQ40_02500 [Clostridiales bacterium]|jgi:hypothetical protein|nr:hypothetical protein [Clostridiales bacterium]